MSSPALRHDLHPALSKVLREAGAEPRRPPTEGTWGLLLAVLDDAFSRHEREMLERRRGRAPRFRRPRTGDAAGPEGAAFRVAPAPMLAVAANGVVRAANDAFVALAGAPPGRVDVVRLVDPADRDRASAMLAEAVAGTSVSGELAWLTPGGAAALPTRIEPARDGVLVVVDDVRRQREADRRLRHAERLASVGELAAGIVHEIATPVQFLADTVAFLNEAVEAHQRAVGRISAGEPVAEVLAAEDLDWYAGEVAGARAQADQTIERIRRLISAVKRLSHPDTRRGAIDVTELVADAVAVAHHRCKRVADITVDADEGDVEVVAADMSQVLVNLLVNAADAIETTGRRGRIHVEARVHPEAVTIAVSDDGPGIPEDIRQRIFEPFFTTKPEGRGTGQGLALARDVIDAHGGVLTVDSVPGRGTTFTLSVPRHPR